MGVLIGGTHAQGNDWVDSPDGAVYGHELEYYVHGILKIEYVDRPVLCLKEDAAAIGSTILAPPDPLVCFVSQAGNVSFGSGWSTLGASGSNFSPSLQMLAVRYRRFTPGLFDWELPADVTVSCSVSGTTATTNLFFDGTKFMSWPIPHRTCDLHPIIFGGKAVNTDVYRIIMYVNGFRVDSWEIDHGGQDLDPERILDHRLHWVHSTGQYARLVVLNTTILDMSKV